MKIYRVVVRPGHLELTPTRALNLAQVAFDEGRTHDAERLVHLAYAMLDGSTNHLESTMLRVQPTSDDDRPQPTIY
jgi:hypothetical protein